MPLGKTDILYSSLCAPVKIYQLGVAILIRPERRPLVLQNVWVDRERR